MVIDPISDMLTRIRNAQMVDKEYVEVPASKIKTEIVKILKQEGYVKEFEELPLKGDFKKIKITLKYFQRKPVIQGLKRISKPSLRQYVNRENLPRVLGGLGIAILSTPNGVMTDKEARCQRVGGEVLCHIW